MRVALQPAFILHRRPYRDTSLLLEIFSRDYGRIGLVARGVRRPRARLKGLLQPFTPLLLSWSGKGELMTLIAAEESEPPRAALPSAHLLSGFYVNELMLRLFPRYDSHPGLFADYDQVLRDLGEVANEEPSLRIFEKRLLAELGYGLLLDVEAIAHEPIEPEGVYRYILEQGPVAADRTGVGIRISGKSLLALRFETLHDPAVLREVKQLTRAAIALHLQGQPLRTRELFFATRRSRRGYGG